MSVQTGFPTVGEVIRFAYKASGVLPQKRDEALDVDEVERKRLQKALQRLVAEEGDLQTNMGKLVQRLSYLTTGYIPLLPINLAVGDVLFAILDVYAGVIKDEGTYQEPRASLRWMIEERLMPAMAITLASGVVKYKLATLAAYFPDPLSCLPNSGSDKTASPLSAVMRWIYARVGVSPTQFHRPNDTQDQDIVERDRDLENAQNWMRGAYLPSAAALHWTFGRGFDRLSRTSEAEPNADPEQCLRFDCMRMALFVARFASYLLQQLEKVFGQAVVLHLVQRFAAMLEMALEEARQVDRHIDELAQSYDRSPLDPALRRDVVTQWLHDLAERQSYAVAALQTAWLDKAVNDDTIALLVRQYGKLSVLPYVEQFQQGSSGVPEEFVQALGKGMNLAKHDELTGTDIDAYEAGLVSNGTDFQLPWMAAWLRFLLHYREESYESAWPHIAQAFRCAKYCAGAKQRHIVNHYIELAAKLGKRREFEKGVHWAHFIGIELRWLRDRNMSDEGLDCVMEMMRRVRYSV